MREGKQVLEDVEEKIGLRGWYKRIWVFEKIEDGLSRALGVIREADGSNDPDAGQTDERAVLDGPVEEEGEEGAMSPTSTDLTDVVPTDK